MKRNILLVLLLVVACQMYGQVVSVPYFCGFEDENENANWVLNPGSAAIVNHPKFINKWGIGSAAAKQGYKSLYVYADNNPDIATYTDAAMYTFAYREFSLPQGEYELAFSWRGLGEENADEIIVYWMPASVNVNSQLTYTPPVLLNSYKIIFPSYPSGGLSGAAAWRYACTTVRVTSAQNYKLVFLWHNNADNTYNPGGCIDNVQIAAKKNLAECGTVPTDIRTKSVDGTLTVSWNPVPDATYDLYYWIEGSGLTDSVVGLTSASYSMQTADMNTGLYTFWVRSVCADGTKSIYGELSGVKIIGKTLKIATACPEVSFFESFIGEDGIKVMVPECSGEPFLLKPRIVGGGGSIAGYTVEEIPYAPPFPLNQGTPFQVNGGWADDVWSNPIPLPFSFCFFDGIYNQAQVGANGIISFNADYRGGGRCEWNLRNEPDIPATDFQYLNCIFGVYEDGHAGKITDGGIYYGVLGEYPCRTLTVSWDRVPTFGSVMSSCPPRKENSYQIVLYEGTNVIDVYVKNRYLCPDWNDGIGIIGIINDDGTEGMAAPGRNITDDWEVDESDSEAWRFVPLTSSVYEMTWYAGKGFGGEVLGKGDSLWIDPLSDIDTVTVRLQFTACNGSYFDLADTTAIQWARIDTLPPVKASICAGDVYSDRYIERADTAGHYETVIRSSLGCDSVVYQLDLDVLSVTSVQIDATLCYGDTMHFNGAVYTKSGTYSYVHKYAAGCDSVAEELHLTVLPRINYAVKVTDALTGPNSGKISLILADDSYYYTLDGKINAPLDGLGAGTYELVVYNTHGCAAVPELVTVVSECLEADIVLPLEMICADYPNFVVPFDKHAGVITAWSLLFSDAARRAGFSDLKYIEEEITRNENGLNDITVPLPANVRPGAYSATLVLHDLNCGDHVYPFDFTVLYKSSVIAQKWNNVLAVLNEKYNGGYTFSAYQWYRNGFPVGVGSGSYFHLGSDGIFEEGDMWQVGLVRRGETEEVLTCPFFPVVLPDATEAPVVKRDNGWWNVEMSGFEDAVVTVYNSMGGIVARVSMQDGTARVPVPAQKGVYIIEICNVDGCRIVLRQIVD